MIELNTLLRGVRDHGGGQYSAFCPVCERDKPTGDGHLYFKREGDRVLLHCKKGCSVASVCDALGIRQSYLFEKREPSVVPAARPVRREHIYCDAAGLPVCRKVIDKHPGGEKRTAQYRWEAGEWKPGLNGLKAPLYHLPQLLASTDTIWFVEGEKDVETMERLGFTATTTPNGAGQAKIPDDQLAIFTGRQVRILGDHDEPGRNYAEVLRRTLHKHAEHVLIVPPDTVWADIPEKGDISDIATALGDEATIEALRGAERTAEQNDLYSRPYIWRDGNKEAVSPTALHEYIHQHLHYYFARSDPKAGVQRYIYRDGAYRLVSEKEFLGVIKSFIPHPLHKTSTLGEVWGLLTTDNDRYISPEAFDTDERIINFRNGLLDLDTMTLHPHSPTVLSSVQIPCNWNPQAEAPPDSAFQRYLYHLCAGDGDRMAFLLEFMGAVLSNIPGHRTKSALFLIGAGNTGKSKYRELLVRLVGEQNSTTADMSDLEVRFATSTLYGKRLAGCGDLGYMKLSEVSIFKQLTGADPIRGEFKGEGAFHFVYRGWLCFCGNAMPLFGGDKGDHVYNRMRIIPCNNPVEHPDPYLIDKMFAEREYIVRLAVEHLAAFRARGCVFTEPACIAETRAQFERENDTVLTFLEECTEQFEPNDPRERTKTSDVYGAYQVWCRANQYHAENATGFRDALRRKRLCDEKKISGYFYYTQFRLTDEAYQDYMRQRR